MNLMERCLDFEDMQIFLSLFVFAAEEPLAVVKLSNSIFHTQENNSKLSHLLFKKTKTTFVAEWKIAHFFVVFLWLL